MTDQERCGCGFEDCPLCYPDATQPRKPLPCNCGSQYNRERLREAGERFAEKVEERMKQDRKPPGVVWLDCTNSNHGYYELKMERTRDTDTPYVPQADYEVMQKAFTKLSNVLVGFYPPDIPWDASLSADEMALNIRSSHEQQLREARERIKSWEVHCKDFAEQVDEQTTKIELLKKAVASRHDYGPASPGEQEWAWQQFCRRSGWAPDSHPSAKDAYVNGYCDGDTYSEGDEQRKILRKEIEQLKKKLTAADQRYYET